MIKSTHCKSHILNVLAGCPGGELPGNDVISSVLAAVGGADGDRMACFNARHDLKMRGLIADGTQKGWWAITPAGRACAAGSPLPKRAVTPAESPVTPAESPVTPAESPVTPTVTRERVLKVIPQVSPPPWYNDDDLRAMVVEETACFGAWSAKSGECGRCYLAGWCRNAKAALYTRLASEITTKETAPIPAPVSAEVAELDAAISADNAPGTPRTAPTADGLTMKSRADGVCGLTGAPIRKGDSVRYVRGTGLVLVK
jgi:hypothetical protein